MVIIGQVNLIYYHGMTRLTSFHVGSVVSLNTRVLALLTK